MKIILLISTFRLIIFFRRFKFKETMKMAQDLAEIVRPFVEKGLFENAENAVRNLMTDYVLHQIEQYRKVVEKYEAKYGMKYGQFTHYINERAKTLEKNSSIHKNLMAEEEDALEWKIANEMLESWLGLREEVKSKEG